MALINCSECNNEVSDKAVACPKCGCPISNKIEPVQTIQKTGKKYKGNMVLFAAAVFAGLWMSQIGTVKIYQYAGIFIAVVGCIGLIYTKIAIWWNHD